jgi:beta-hydroxylase
MFYNPDSSAAAAILVENYALIRDELHRLRRNQFVAWPETELYTGDWEVFGFYAFGQRLNVNCSLCPATAAVLDRIGCGMQAGFSRLAANTRINAHRGRPKHALRCHLGLDIPAGDVALRVGDEIRHWESGRCLLFDDTGEHEAWNNSRHDRIVLLVDVSPGTA